MTIYIDSINNITYRNLTGWFHIITDGDIEELHKFAFDLGLKRNWFQDKKDRPHYDAYKNKKDKALELGAIEITTREQIEILKRMK